MNTLEPRCCPNLIEILNAACNLFGYGSRERALILVAYGMSKGSSRWIKRASRHIGQQMTGTSRSRRSQSDICRYAYRKLKQRQDGNPLLQIESRASAERLPLQFRCTGWANIVAVEDLFPRLNEFSPTQHEERIAEAVRRCFPAPQLKAVRSSGHTLHSEELQTQIRKDKKTILTLSRNVHRFVSELGFNPNVEIEQLIKQIRSINHRQPETEEKADAGGGRGSLRHYVKFRKKTRPEEKQNEPGWFEIPEANEIPAGPEIPPVENAKSSTSATIIVKKPKVKTPIQHARLEIETYETWGISAVSVTTLNIDQRGTGFTKALKLSDRDGIACLLATAASAHCSVSVRFPQRLRRAGIGVFQLDDLDGSSARNVVEFFGGLVKETSPKNFQTIFALRGAGRRAIYDTVSRGLKVKTGADLCASGASRLAGSYNVKVVHESKVGTYPMVRIALIGKGELRTVRDAMESPFYEPQNMPTNAAVATFEYDNSGCAWNGFVPSIERIESDLVQAGKLSSRPQWEGRADQSAVHFRYLLLTCCSMIRANRVNRDELLALLLRDSDSARWRWDQGEREYFDRTREKAERWAARMIASENENQTKRVA